MKDKYCFNCLNYDGEECNRGEYEGSLRYDDSPACDDFERDNEVIV